MASPCKCIVDSNAPQIPSHLFSWNTQLLNVADDKLPCTKAPTLLLANSQRVATTVVAEVGFVKNNAKSLHPFNANRIIQLLHASFVYHDHLHLYLSQSYF